MPIDYRRDDDLRLVTVTVTEPYDFQDLLAMLDRQSAENAWQYALFYDMRATTERTANQIEELVARVREIGMGRARGPVGVAIAPRPQVVRSTVLNAARSAGRLSFEMLLTTQQIQNWLAERKKESAKDK